MISKLINFWKLIKENAYSLFSTNFNRIQYGEIDWLFTLGIVVLVILLLKAILEILKAPKHSRKDTGHSLYGKSSLGIFGKLFNFIPKLLLLPLVALVLVTLADPFLSELGETQEIVQSRIRIDVRDTSQSMADYFYFTQKSKGEVAAENHLEFIKMRKGKKDKVSFWLFASNPYMIQEFIIDDDELYYLQVYDSPWLTFNSCPTDSMTSYRLGIPPGRCANITGDGGGTNVRLVLRAIIKYLDEDLESQKVKKGSILIITDADVDQFPEAELERLQNSRIVIYIIYLTRAPYKNPTTGELTPSPIPKFAERIHEFGGKYFNVVDPDELKKAYQEIDRLETTEFQVKRYGLRKDLYQLFLSVALIGIFVVILFGLFMEILWPRYP